MHTWVSPCTCGVRGQLWSLSSAHNVGSGHQTRATRLPFGRSLCLRRPVSAPHDLVLKKHCQSQWLRQQLGAGITLPEKTNGALIILFSLLSSTSRELPAWVLLGLSSPYVNLHIRKHTHTCSHSQVHIMLPHTHT